MNKAVEVKPLTVKISPSGEVLKGEYGDNLYQLLNRFGYTVASACGGMGICGKCRVLFLSGAKAPTESEKLHLTPDELQAGWRLSCQQRLDREITIEVPQVDEATDAKERMSQPCDVALEVGVEKIYLELAPPSRQDQRPHTLRIQDAVGRGPLDFPLSVLQSLSRILRAANYKVTIVLNDEHVLDIRAGDGSSQCYGVAIDIGTTTIAGYLISLCTGKELAIRSQMNPQQRYGADVISRIKHVRDHADEGLADLHNAITNGLNMLMKQLVLAADVSPDDIYNVTIVGNPTMLHLLLSIDPRGIDQSPYVPVLRDGIVVSASRMDLKVNPEGNVWMLPSVAGYVGSDITAGILHTGIYELDGLNLFVDIGTNAEIVLGNKDKLIACSTPAGPAFEGAGISYGMRATPGAISHVKLCDDSVSLQVVGQAHAKGICGSGLIDAVSELVRIGLIDSKGRLLSDPDLPYGERIDRDRSGHTRFRLTDEQTPIYVTQSDVRELQLAKGAVNAGVESLLAVSEATVEDVDRVFLAGAFGTYVKRESVKQIGMLPAFSVEKVSSVGNAAGQGAKLGLLSRTKWRQVQELVEQIEYFELSFYEGFSDRYINSMYFPKPIHNKEGTNGSDNRRRTGSNAGQTGA